MSDTDPIPPVPPSDVMTAVRPLAGDPAAPKPEPYKFKGKLPAPTTFVMVGIRGRKERHLAMVVSIDAEGTMTAFVYHGLGKPGAEMVQVIYAPDRPVENIQSPSRWYPRA